MGNIVPLVRMWWYFFVTFFQAVFGTDILLFFQDIYQFIHVDNHSFTCLQPISLRFTFLESTVSTSHMSKALFSWFFYVKLSLPCFLKCVVTLKNIYRSILSLPDLFTCGKRCQTIQNIAVFFHCRYFVYFCLMKSKGIFFALYHNHIGDHSLTFLCENGLSWWFANRQWMAYKTVVKFCHIAQTDH